MPNILVINGSILGKQGNTQKILVQYAERIRAFSPQTKLDFWFLAESEFAPGDIQKKFASADAVIISSGTYWSSWGSPLQKLLEEMTFLEGQPELMGKPASVLVTMHSVGGLEVCTRLQGVLATMGFLIPPMCHMAFSLAGHLASSTASEFAQDFWSPKDLDTLAQNLLLSLKYQQRFLPWTVDLKDPKRLWY